MSPGTIPRRTAVLALTAALPLAAFAAVGARSVLNRPRSETTLPVIGNVAEGTSTGTSPSPREYRELNLTSDRGVAEIRYYAASAARSAVIWLPGAHREWRGPAAGLYPRLAADLQRDGIASAWVRYLDAGNRATATNAARIALSYLLNEGVVTAAMVGHSFGGAVAIHAAASAPQVKTVVTLATQAEDTSPVSRLGPHCSILLIHGDADRVLPPINSAEVYARAREPKRFERLAGASHSLDESATDTTELVTTWLRQTLT